MSHAEVAEATARSASVPMVPLSSGGAASGASPDSTINQSKSNNNNNSGSLDVIKDDGEGDKVPRAPIACSACRARKVKCSGDKPVCITCAKTNQTCIYTPHAKRKRKVRVKAGAAEPVVNRPRHESTANVSQVTGFSSTPAQQQPPTNGQNHPNQIDVQHVFPAVPVPIPPLGVAGPSTYAQTHTTNSSNPLPWYSTVDIPSGSGEPYLSSTPRQYQYDLTDPSHVPGLDFLHDVLSWQGISNHTDSTALQGSSVSNVDNQSTDSHLPLDLSGLLGWDPAMNTMRPDTGGNGVLSRDAPVIDSSTNQSDVGSYAERQVPGQDSSQSRFRVPYFRFFGPTAIAPGYKRVVYDVSRPPSPKTASAAFPSGPDLDAPGVCIMDKGEEFPHVEALKHLIPIFVQHFGYFFPFLRFSPTDLDSDEREKPAYLLNMICAVAARYSPTYGRKSREADNFQSLPSIPTAAAAHVWASKAKEQVSSNLGFSSAHMVETLLLISWYEFGQDRDGGLWMYSGMGLRMGQDLGELHRGYGVPMTQMIHCAGLDSLVKQSRDDAEPAPSTMDGDEIEAWRLHCSLMMMDAIMTIGTGRPGMYITANATIPEFPPLMTASGASVPDPFGYLAKILVLVDRTTRILVQDTKEDIEPLLEKAQSALNEFHTSLPSELRFETSTFQQYASIGQGSSFVLLHLWFHTLIILSYRPSLLRSDSVASDLSESDAAGNEIAISSAKTILDIVSFAELIDAKAVHQPWINYPLYTAGRTFLSQSLLAKSAIEDPSDFRSAGRVHLAKTARANFQRVVSIFSTLEKYWSGVRYIHSALMQKAEGVHSVTLIKGDGESVDDVPSPLAALWSGSPPANRSGVVGLSFTGTMNSPTDNFFSLLYPSSAVTASAQPVEQGESSS
ncbi:hypothetical protein I317_05735 [Kwoniella heveanensis CBS 569]|nr:hypothetical protein I317_05735 [Kwoniella heveanensis CBS 569]